MKIVPDFFFLFFSSYTVNPFFLLVNAACMYSFRSQHRGRWGSERKTSPNLIFLGARGSIRPFPIQKKNLSPRLFGCMLLEITDALMNGSLHPTLHPSHHPRDSRNIMTGQRIISEIEGRKDSQPPGGQELTEYNHVPHITNTQLPYE